MSTNAENACIELKKTYNANILKKYSPEIQETFKIVCNLYKHSNKPKLNKNLVKLINNLQYPPKPSKYLTKFITGPGEITRLKHPTLPQDIYLFGENDHSNKYGCLQNDIKIEKYLEQLFYTTTKFIDIYIEFQIELNQFSRKDCDTLGQQNTLCDIYKFFRKCITSDSTTCNYPIRLHPTDVRNTRKNDTYKLYQMLIDLWYITDITTFKYFINKHSYYLDNIQEINNESKQYIINSIFKNKTIKKEIKRTTLSPQQIEKALKSSKIWSTIQKSSRNIKPIYQKLKSDKKYIPYNYNIIRDIADLTIYLRNISCLHMDIYTLARMFKKFNVTSDHHPPKPLNIIYYAGQQHTNFMSFMLQELDFKITEQSIPVPYTLSCTNIKSLKQPLFS
jgi:hypothetical protein